MANEYVKTSKEELTAMADELRAVGPFQEGQEFVFPSSEYDENPIYIYKIVDNGAWSEITQAEAIELADQGYDIQRVEEFSLISEADNNTIYYTIEMHLGFAEGYQKTIDNFYQKVYHGTLTQEDVDEIVFDLTSINCFESLTLVVSRASFPNIEEISVTPGFLDSALNCNRLSALKTVNIINPNNNSIIIGNTKFFGCVNLEKIKCQPTFIGSHAFAFCKNLLLGVDSLLLDLCQTLKMECFTDVPIEEVSLLSCQSIEDGVFIRKQNQEQLEKVYLPAIPPTLSNIKAFQYYDSTSTPRTYGINPTLKFYVPSGAKATYASATNWSSFIDGSLDGIDHFEELGGGN